MSDQVTFKINTDSEVAEAQIVDDYSVETSKANGGTELMYRWLKARIDPQLFDQFQIICSRVRHLEDKPRILWVHDTAHDPEVQFLKTNPKRMDDFDIIVFVSHWQQQMYNIFLNVPYEKGLVIPHAIEQFDDHQKPKDGKLQLIYASTPHRGLDVLLNAVEQLDRDDFELHVYSSFKIYDRGHMDAQFQQLYDKAKSMKNVHYHGTVSNDEIRQAMIKSHILAYPSTYVETSCITAIEALSSGLLTICPNLGALPETAANFAWLYNFEQDKNRHAHVFARILDRAIVHYWEPSVQSLLNIQSNYFRIFYSWDNRIDKWYQLMHSLLQMRKAQENNPEKS